MSVHLVGPVGLQDPARPSGGNVYDLRLAAALAARGVDVTLHEAAVAELHSLLTQLPDGDVVVVDGLVGSAAPAALEAVRRRLTVLLLVHLPLGVPVAGSSARPGAERRALAAVDAVVCTSTWTRDWLVRAYRLPPEHAHVVTPGVDKASPASSSRAGGRLLSVGAITPVKGHDLLVAALTELADVAWSWTLVGASVDGGHAAEVWADLCAAGLDDRVTLAGVLSGPALASAYAAADLLVLPSRHETYGMVATEALAHAVPVLATDVGGVREALGPGGTAGVLVPPEDPVALATALRSWLSEASLRARLRRGAAARRETLEGWDVTASAFVGVLAGLEV